MEIAIVLAVFVAGLVLINRLSARHVKYSHRVFLGLGLGILFGGFIQLLLGAESSSTQTAMEWINIVGSGYVSFLQMLVVPLILVSLIRAFTEVSGENNIQKIGFNVLAVLMITVMIASALGIIFVLLFNLDGAEFARGAAEAARIEQLQEQSAQVADLTIPQQIVSFIPKNIFQDLAGARGTSTIAVVVFSTFVGIAYLGVARKNPEQADMFKKIVDALHAIVTRIVTLVLRMAPYGIFALMTRMVATSNVQSLINMGTFVIACYAALLTMFGIHMLILATYKVSPVQYLKKAWNVLSFAFSSRSSAGALPLNIATQKEALGVDPTTANFSATFGLSIGQNGCAGIYPTMLVAIVAPTVGMDLFDPMVWLTIIVTVAISSFGVAGVGGGATFASLIIFGALGLPVDMVGLMVSIEPIVDMGRTALNVNDSILAGVVTSRNLGTFDREIFEDDARQVDPEMSV